MRKTEDGGALGRELGHVEFAGKYGRNRQNSWRDWALIALDSDTTPSAHLPTSSLAPRFKTSVVYFRNFFEELLSRNPKELGFSSEPQRWGQVGACGIHKAVHESRLACKRRQLHAASSSEA